MIINKTIILLIIILSSAIGYSQNSTCNLQLQKGIYYSVSGPNKQDTTFHKISGKFFIGFSKETSFYYKNKLTWSDSCNFRSEHFKNNSEMPHFKKGTGYKCRLLEVKPNFFRFSFYGEETGSSGELIYYKYDGKIPEEYKKIKKMNHNPQG